MAYSDDAVVEVSVSERPKLVRVAVGGDVHEGRWSNNEEVVANEGDEGVLKAALTAWEGPNRFSLSWAELQGRGGGWV